MDKCPGCGKYVPKLFPLDNADVSSQWSALVEVAYPCTDYLCIKCITQRVGITKRDVDREERVEDNTYFNINLLKGNIAQSIIGMIFRDCGYEVYPFGHESYFTNIIKNLKKGSANITAKYVVQNISLSLFVTIYFVYLLLA